MSPNQLVIRAIFASVTAQAMSYQQRHPGGWLQSSPTIAELGFPLGTRAQMMWLENDSPTSLQPQTRPRSTLSPTIVTSADGSVLAVGTPGGDQQDQWQTSFIVRHLVHGMSFAGRN